MATFVVGIGVLFIAFTGRDLLASFIVTVICLIVLLTAFTLFSGGVYLEANRLTHIVKKYAIEQIRLSHSVTSVMNPTADSLSSQPMTTSLRAWFVAMLDPYTQAHESPGTTIRVWAFEILQSIGYDYSEIFELANDLDRLQNRVLLSLSLSLYQPHYYTLGLLTSLSSGQSKRYLA